MGDDDDYTEILKKQLTGTVYKAASAAWKANDWDSASLPSAGGGGDGGGGASPWKPLDWNSVAIPVDSLSSGSITAVTNTYTQSPGELLDYTMKYDMHWIQASGMPEAELNLHVKRELAAKLAQQMMDDGHIVFTKQHDLADNSMRFKAYTWVGNKHFIEQQRQRKNK
jgi:hypothetical protein